MNLADRNPQRRADYVPTTNRRTVITENKILALTREKGVVIAWKVVNQGSNSRVSVGGNERFETIDPGQAEIADFCDFPYCHADELEFRFAVIDELSASVHKLLLIEKVVKCAE